MVGSLPAGQSLCVEACVVARSVAAGLGPAREAANPIPTHAESRYNHAMRPRLTVESPPVSLILMLIVAAAC